VVDDIVCAARELIRVGASEAGSSMRCVSASTVNSLAASWLAGVDSVVACSTLAVGPSDGEVCLVGSVVGGGSSGGSAVGVAVGTSASFGSVGSVVSVGSVGSEVSSVLVWAPPVLTTTPGGA
jgi:hypothetical protein